MATLFGHVSLELLDKLGVTVSAPVYAEYDDTKTIAQALGDVQALINAYDPLTDSQITSARMVIQATLPSGTIKTAPNATAENERTGLFNFSQSGSPYKFGVDVPGFKEALIVNGKIDLTASEVTNFITFLTTAGTVLTYVSTAIKALVALIDALLSFRKHRKAESRRSFEIG